MLEHQIDDQRGEQSQRLGHEQPADDGDAQRLSQLGARADADGERHGAEHGGEGGHHDGAKADRAGPANRLLGTGILVALSVQGEVDHEDGILLHDAHQQDDADKRNQRQLGARQNEGQQRAQAGRR